MVGTLFLLVICCVQSVEAAFFGTLRIVSMTSEATANCDNFELHGGCDIFNKVWVYNDGAKVYHGWTDHAYDSGRDKGGDYDWK